MSVHKIRMILLRHGKTQGNLEHRYVSTTDEPILPEERDILLERAQTFQKQHLEGHRAFAVTSPLLRCRQTLELLAPGLDAVQEPLLREMNFGAFEYRNYAELNGNPDYQRYIDSGGESAFPGGESKREFTERTAEGFRQVIAQMKCATENGSGNSPDNSSAMADTLLVVVHGGTIMAILDQFAVPHRDYFDWQCGCLQGYTGILDIREGEQPALWEVGQLDLRRSDL